MALVLVLGAMVNRAYSTRDVMDAAARRKNAAWLLVWVAFELAGDRAMTAAIATRAVNAATARRLKWLHGRVWSCSDAHVRRSGGSCHALRCGPILANRPIEVPVKARGELVVGVRE